MPGIIGDEYENPLVGTLLGTNALETADVILSLGSRFDFRLGSGRTVSKEAKVIQVHTDTWQIGFNLRADIGIVGGAGPVSSQLLEAVKGRRKKPAELSWIGKDVKSGRWLIPDAYLAEGVPVHPGRCAGEVVKFLEEEARDWTVVCDGGEAGVWLGIAAKAQRPGQLHASGANGTIGTGPALAVGAWAANRKPVLWYTGGWKLRFLRNGTGYHGKAGHTGCVRDFE